MTPGRKLDILYEALFPLGCYDHSYTQYGILEQSSLMKSQRNGAILLVAWASMFHWRVAMELEI
jgi:hypothetical protein